MRSGIDFKNKKIGKLLVLHRVEDKIDCGGHPIRQWKCVCECGEIVIRKSYHLKRGRCSCKKCKALEDAKKFGYQDIRQHHWYNIEKHAYKRNLEFNISMEYAWELYEKQDKKCALSGMPIIFAKNKVGHTRGETTASLDRIDSKKGYIENNVQWLHKWINTMKMDFEQEEFIEFCRLITEQNAKSKITD
jgi:hypothetical protein